ncbi:MAG: SDR family oxidoreductase [Anaerolineae bacterium]|nr:SDR family oxidoreductase [Anaerolineae bacterium]
MAGQLAGKTAVVTGASRGIGRAAALALAREGANVIVTARTESDLLTLATEIEELGTRALAVAGDASQEADVERLAAETFAAFPQVDILVNNLGVAKYAPLGELTTADYDWMMNTNMRSNFLCTQAFLPGMLERRAGSIIFVSSVAGLRGFNRETVYCATKFAQVGFAQALDAEVYPKGVKVSVIAPGGVNTYLALGSGRTAGDPKLQTYLDAEDVADAVVFAAAQPVKSRVFLIGMRPMSEPL